MLNTREFNTIQMHGTRGHTAQGSVGQTAVAQALLQGVLFAGIHANHSPALAFSKPKSVPPDTGIGLNIKAQTAMQGPFEEAQKQPTVRDIVHG